MGSQGEQTQQRVELAKLRHVARVDGGLVARYAAEMLRGSLFPPINVVSLCDGTFVVLHGLHRAAAARFINPAGTIEALVSTCPAGKQPPLPCTCPSEMRVEALIEWLVAALAPPEWLDSVAEDAQR